MIRPPISDPMSNEAWRHAVAGLLLFSSIGCSAKGGSTPPEEPIQPARQVEPEPHVTLHSTPDGLTARFELVEPTQTIAFADGAGVNRESWTMLTPGLSLEGFSVTGSEPFSAFEIAIAVDPRELDRIYPSLHRVGKGYVVYGPAFELEELSMRVDVELDEDQQLQPPAEPERGYFYLGPDPTRAGSGFTLTSGTDTPWLSEALSGAFDDSLTYYAQWLGDVPTPPTVFVSTQSNLSGGFRGDVAGESTISLRFAELNRAEQLEPLRVHLSRFVHHEVFHLWNAVVAAEDVPWFHEGGAEYAAMVAIVSQQQMTQDEALSQLSQMATMCRKALGDDALEGARLRGQDIYACGVLLQWLADVEARARSSGKEHVFTIWADLREDSKASKEEAVQRFIASVGPATSLVLKHGGPERWSKVLEELDGLGVQIDQTPPQVSYRTSIIVHLLEQNCEASTKRGFWNQPDGVKLDTPESCGAIAGNPEVVGVEGHDLVSEADEAFRALQEACDGRQGVRLQRRSGRDLVARCETPPSTPTGFRIVSAPPLALERQSSVQ